MQDLGGYGITAQSFEFLCTADPKGSRPHRARTGAQVDARTRTARSGRSTCARTSSGMTARRSPPTTSSPPWSASSRPATPASRACCRPGGAVAKDANTVMFTLAGGNGNFPYLVSVFNAQTLITPKAYAAGTTLDKVPAGTGAWKLKTYNAQTGATFERNPDWWGGKTPLDGIEFIFFDATGPMVTAYQGEQVDAHRPVRRPVRASRCSTTRTSTSSPPRRRSIARSGCACDKGQFADKEVRQALALTFDRPALIQQLFQGKAQLGNDHVIWQGYPYFDPSVPQRAQDIAKAKQLLSDGRRDQPDGDPPCGQLLEIPDLATLLKSQAQQAGITLNVGRREPRHVLRGAVVPRRAGRSAVLRRRRARHRRLRPPRRPRTSTSTRPSRPRASGTRRSTRRRRSTGVHRTSRPPSASMPRRRPAPRSRRSCRGHADRPAVLLQLPRRATRRASPASTRAPSGRCSSRRPPRAPDLARRRVAGLDRSTLRPHPTSHGLR